MHLRDAEGTRGLALREAFREAQVQQEPLTMVQALEGTHKAESTIDRLESHVQLSEVLDEAVSGAAISPQLGVERHNPRRLTELDHLDYLDLRDGQVRAELTGRGNPSQLSRERFGPLTDRDAQLLHASGKTDAGGAIAEVTADLADDRGRGEGGERDPRTGIVPLDGVQQPQAGDLIHVVERFPAMCEAEGQGSGQPHVQRHELLAHGGITGISVCDEQGADTLSLRPASPRAALAQRALSGIICCVSVTLVAPV